MKEDYVQILQENLKSTARRLAPGCSWSFQQANDPKYTPGVIRVSQQGGWCQLCDELVTSGCPPPICQGRLRLAPAPSRPCKEL